jgi:hypothetical protein
MKVNYIITLFTFKSFENHQKCWIIMDQNKYLTLVLVEYQKFNCNQYSNAIWHWIKHKYYWSLEEQKFQPI